jgi:hypothetical protein
MNNLANSVSIDEAEFLIYSTLSKAFRGGTIPPNICMSGSMGTAKSSLVFQTAQKLSKDLGKSVEVIDLRLAAAEESTVLGIPFVAETGEIGRAWRSTIDAETGEVTEGYVEYNMRDMFYSTPFYFPRDPNKFYILFMDELMNTRLQIQHAAYRILLDRTSQNGTKLPDSCAIIGAGNLVEDKTGAKPLAPAFANRFAMHLVLDRNRAKDSYVRYAIQSNFEQVVIAYLNYRSENLYVAPVNGEHAFPTQRSWEYADGHLKNEEIAEHHHFLSIAVCSAIGSVVGTDFMGFLLNWKKLPDWAMIRSGATYTPPADDEQLKYALSTAVAFQLIDAIRNAGDDHSEVDNLCKVVAQLPKEGRIVMFKTMKCADMKMTAKFMRFPSLLAQWKNVSPHIKK